MVLQPILFAIETFGITTFIRECHLQSVRDSVNNQASVVLLNMRIQNTQFTHISSFKTKIREATKATFKCILDIQDSREIKGLRHKQNSNQTDSRRLTYGRILSTGAHT